MSPIWSRCGACERRTLGARLCRPCRSALDLAYQRALMRERFPVPGLRPRTRLVAPPSPGWVPWEYLKGAA
jgi:hypothetical protein